MTDLPSPADNLRIAGSPARQSLASASITTPDRLAEDIATEAGDLSVDIASTVGLPTPNISHSNSFSRLPSVNGDLVMSDAPNGAAISTGHTTSPTSVKRKQPASAFSSESDLEDSPARNGANGGSAMSLDASFIAPPPPPPLPTPSVPLEPQQSLPFDLAIVPESKVLEAELKEEPVVEEAASEDAPQEAVKEEEAPKPKRSTRRSSAGGARAIATPRRRSARPSRGATPAAASESDPNEELTPEPAPVVGMTTRRRAKAARLA